MVEMGGFSSRCEFCKLEGFLYCDFINDDELYRELFRFYINNLLRTIEVVDVILLFTKQETSHKIPLSMTEVMLRNYKVTTKRVIIFVQIFGLSFFPYRKHEIKILLKT